MKIFAKFNKWYDNVKEPLRFLIFFVGMILVLAIQTLIGILVSVNAGYIFFGALAIFVVFVRCFNRWDENT